MQKILDNWNTILDTVASELDLTQISVETWLQPLDPYCIIDDTLYIVVDDEQQMSKNYIQRKYSLPIKVAIAEITGQEYQINIVLPSELPKEAQPEAEVEVTSAASSKSPDTANLNPNYTFDNFIVGSNNRFAYSASLAVAESPGEIYNPLLIHGGVGLGKTHLMQSIAHFIKSRNPSSVVRYVSSETFTNELIESIRNGTTSKFREKYRDIDVLLIDDIQFIIGKESTQEEFFHTFNELHIAKKQIIISSDKPPKDMEVLEDRIRTRLEWGLIANIGAPDYETRMAILKCKEEIDNFYLKEDILKYIATNITSNIRELEGALNKLKAYHHLEQTEITMEIAVRELKNIISPNIPAEITPDFIIDVVCDYFNVGRAEILSSTRRANIVFPRQLIMYLLRKNCNNMTLTTIGSLLGKRDHSTILSGINKIEDEIKTKEETRKLVDTLQSKINPV